MTSGLYPITVIGSWAHADATVEEITWRSGFWECADLARADLERLMAGGLDAAHALVAAVMPEGDIALSDGCHRYAVGRDLGFASLPVEFRSYEECFEAPYRMAATDVTHACPPEGGDGLMPCCGLTPFEVSRWDRITLDPGLVTCRQVRSRSSR